MRSCHGWPITGPDCLSTSTVTDLRLSKTSAVHGIMKRASHKGHSQVLILLYHRKEMITVGFTHTVVVLVTSTTTDATKESAHATGLCTTNTIHKFENKQTLENKFWRGPTAGPVYLSEHGHWQWQWSMPLAAAGTVPSSLPGGAGVCKILLRWWRKRNLPVARPPKKKFCQMCLEAVLVADTVPVSCHSNTT